MLIERLNKVQSIAVLLEYLDSPVPGRRDNECGFSLVYLDVRNLASMSLQTASALGSLAVNDTRILVNIIWQ